MNVKKLDISSKKVKNNQQTVTNIKGISVVQDKTYIIFAHLFKILLIMELERLRKTSRSFMKYALQIVTEQPECN